MLRRILLAALPLALAGCSALAQIGAMRPVETSYLDIRPTLPMLASKIARPLYVVLDPAEVPDSYTIPERTVKEIRILQIHDFVRRDLKRTLASIFDKVEVIGADEFIPTDVLIGQVRIQRFAVEADMATSGGYTAGRVYGQMGWSFAISRPREHAFAFSYADTVTGTFGLVNADQTNEMMESTYRLALERLLAELAKGDVLDRLDQPPPPPPS